MDKLQEGRRVFDIEIEAMEKMRYALNETFEKIVDRVTECQGKVIITGMGKPGHVGAKIAATFSSLGTPSFFLHPAEAMHGDLGMVSKDDVVIAISYSGESDEIIRILPNLKMIGATIIGITGNVSSTLAKYSDLVQILPDFKEACYLGLAPTSSTTVELVYGDALAVVASKIYGFQDSDFGRFHPAGTLGKKLVLKVSDLMTDFDNSPWVYSGASLVAALEEMSQREPGLVTIISKEKQLLGVITDGDIRRLLNRHVDIYSLFVDGIMTTAPKIISPDALAVDALSLMTKYNINSLPVVEGKTLVGTIGRQGVLRSGITL